MLPAASRSSRLVLFVCLVSLAVLWSCRLPRLCIFDQCPQCSGCQDISRVSGSPGNVDVDVDLSAPDSPFVSWPLARVCAETTRWTPGLVFVCDNNSGGIGNIRNFILTCVRYAIEAGATGLTMPAIQTRSEQKLADLFVGKKRGLSYFFDEEHFRASLTGACPQMAIYDALEDVPGLHHGDDDDDDDDKRVGGVQQQPEMITPSHFGLRGGCDQRDLNRHADLFGSRFHAWLDERQRQQRQQRVSRPAISRSHPKLVRFNWGVQWTYPVWRDGPEFASTFGGLLRFQHALLELGMATAHAMRQLVAGAGARFVGIHLRTENDALSFWPDFEAQRGAYLDKIAKLATTPTTASSGPRFVYLATGNATEAAKFASLAQDQQQLGVVTKHQLLASHPALLERLNTLSWDQQAVVDFVVLLQANYFLGVSPSSFSLNVALKRHLSEEGIYTRPWRIGTEEGDGRSWLVGRFDGYWDDWLFMYDSLWP